MTIEAEEQRMHEISHEALVESLKLGQVVLVDVLPRASFIRGHLPGARSLPLSEVQARAAEVLPSKEMSIVTYCASPT
jgi:rhodanese-related sulfurtransferase